MRSGSGAAVSVSCTTQRGPCLENRKTKRENLQYHSNHAAKITGHMVLKVIAHHDIWVIPQKKKCLLIFEVENVYQY